MNFYPFTLFPQHRIICDCAGNGNEEDTERASTWFFFSDQNLDIPSITACDVCVGIKVDQCEELGSWWHYPKGIMCKYHGKDGHQVTFITHQRLIQQNGNCMGRELA